MKAWCQTRVLQETVALYSEPNDTSAIIQQLPLDTEVAICSFNADWAEARPLNNARGFIKAKSQVYFKQSGLLHSEKVNLYSQPNQASTPIKSILQGERIVLDRVIDDKQFCHVKLFTGEEGYIDRTALITNLEKMTFIEAVRSCHKCFGINPDTQNICGKCGASLPPISTPQIVTPSPRPLVEDLTLNSFDFSSRPLSKVAFALIAVVTCLSLKAGHLQIGFGIIAFLGTAVLLVLALVIINLLINFFKRK